MTETCAVRGAWRVHARPDCGGRIGALSFRDHLCLVPIVDGPFDLKAWPKAGAYPLIPFHNRIPEAAFRWRGRDASLPVHPDTRPHALHGHTSRMTWRLTETVEGLDMFLESPAAAHWPWHFRATQRFHFDRNRMRLDLSITNLDCVPMPAGLGWHPYFPAGSRLSDDAGQGWQVGPDFLPENERLGRKELRGDCLYLTGWSQVCVSLPSGPTLKMTASEELAHLVLFKQKKAAFVCAEPVSHPVAALTRGPGGGMYEVAPEETFAASIVLEAL